MLHSLKCESLIAGEISFLSPYFVDIRVVCEVFVVVLCIDHVGRCRQHCLSTQNTGFGGNSFVKIPDYHGETERSAGIARILGVSGRKNGYIENDSYVVTWCVGHLVEMVYPEEYDEKYKKWRLEDLPFLPEQYKYNVIPNVSRQYDVVHRMLHREDIDTVYWAGDAGKEGQTIEENIRKFGGVRKGMRELRVWIDSQTEEEDPAWHPRGARDVRV